MASYEEVIPPGQEGRLQATVRTGELHGSVRRNIALTTNDPERPTRSLQIVLNVVGSVRVYPRNRVVLGDRRGMAVEQVVVVRKDPTETGELKISNARADVDWLEVDVATVSSGELTAPAGVAVRPSDWLVRVRATDTPGPGNHRAKVRFATGLGREPEAEIPVALTLRPTMLLSHQKITLERPSPEAASEFRLTVTLRRGLDPAALEISAMPGAFEIATESRGPRTLEIVVRLPYRQRLPVSGSLQIDHAGGRTSVPIEVRAAAADQ